MVTADNSGLSRWLWLKVLVGGVVAFVLLERALIATTNLSYVPSLLLVGTFTVPAAFCLFLYSRAKQPDVPFVILSLCAIWGGLLGSVLAGYLEYHTLITLGTLPTIAIGIIEELTKIIVPAYFLLRHRYSNELDGIILGAAAGAGFAVLESMGYGLVALLSSWGNISAVNQVLLFRSLTAPAAHIAWTGLVGGALWYGIRSHSPGRFRRLIFTFAGVVVLHTLWDSVTFTWGYFVLGIISLLWLLRRTYHAQKLAPR